MDETPATPPSLVQAMLEVAGAIAVAVVVVDYVRFRWGWDPVTEARRILHQLGH